MFARLRYSIHKALKYFYCDWPSKTNLNYCFQGQGHCLAHLSTVSSRSPLRYRQLTDWSLERQRENRQCRLELYLKLFVFVLSLTSTQHIFMHLSTKFTWMGSRGKWVDFLAQQELLVGLVIWLVRIILMSTHLHNWTAKCNSLKEVLKYSWYMSVQSVSVTREQNKRTEWRSLR